MKKNQSSVESNVKKLNLSTPTVVKKRKIKGNGHLLPKSNLILPTCYSIHIRGVNPHTQFVYKEYFEPSILNLSKKEVLEILNRTFIGLSSLVPEMEVALNKEEFSITMKGKTSFKQVCNMMVGEFFPMSDFGEMSLGNLFHSMAAALSNRAQKP